MADTIKKITIEGFKSIRSLQDFPLRHLNVLIGANGAGKSNLVGFFRLLRELIEQRLQLAVTTEGGADACLYLETKGYATDCGQAVLRGQRLRVRFNANKRQPLGFC